jgi:hypothetical protein
MISARICDPAVNEPFPCFRENTITYVCLPKQAQYQLWVQCERASCLSITAEDEEIFSSTVDADSSCIPLNEILLRSRVVRKAHPILSSFMGKHSKQSERVSTFGVSICKDESCHVAATFRFHLLEPEEYETAYSKHLESRRRATGSAFVVDWQVKPAKTCLNCGHAVSNDQCPNCGADQE